MLYDPKWESETSFFRELSVPSLENLSFALRHREHWPLGFEWDYDSCQSCAMGLAAKLWKEIGPPCTYNVYRPLKISQAQAHKFFLRANRPTDCSMSDVTPEMVADQIDKYLAPSRAA